MRSKSRFYWSAATIGAITASLWVIRAVFTSTSSTAAVGLLFVPVYAAFGALAGMTLLYWGNLTRHLLNSPRHPRILLPWLGLTLGFSILGYGVILKNLNLQALQNPNLPEARIVRIEKMWMPFGRNEIQLLIASHPHTPTWLLETYFNSSDLELRAKAVGHPQAPETLLARVIEEKPHYVLHSGVAASAKLTSKQAQKLIEVRPDDFPSLTEYQLYQTYVLAALAKNPRITDTQFSKLAEWPSPEHFLSVAVLYSSRVTCQQIQIWLKDPESLLYNTAFSVYQRRQCDTQKRNPSR